MSSFNRRYGHALTRVSFWQAMTVKLAEFDSLVHRRESLMPEDVQTLRRIHEALYECYVSSKGRREYHEGSLERLRKECTSMEVKLLTSSKSIADMESFAALAALTCRGNTDKEHVPSEVLGRIINAGHESILEHITLTYSVKELSRACLQEVARHRHISLSVESTRHTLRKSLDELTLLDCTECKEDRVSFVSKFVKFANEHPDMPNDELKYYLPEFWPTNLVLTSNIRELRHILKLRTAPAALKEFQELARELYNVVPDNYKYLLKDCVHEEAKHE